MNWKRLLVGLALLVGVVGAPPAAATAQQDPVTITATVVDQDARAVSGVDVTATWDGGSVTQTTASNGQVLLDVPRGATVSIQVDDDRYVRNRPYVVEDAETEAVQIPVAQSATADITVRDSTGGTVEGARVLLYRDGQFVTDQRTGADGTVTTPAVERGNYRLTVRKAGYYDDQTRVTVASQTSINQTIEQGEVFLTVSAVDNASEPIDATVEIPGIGTLQTGADGEVTTSVPVNSELAVTVTGDGYDRVTRSITVRETDTTVTVRTSRTEPINLSAQNESRIGQQVRIVAVYADGAPVVNASVRQDGQAIGTTDAAGEISVTPESAGRVTYTVDDGNTSAAVTVQVVDPNAQTTPASALDGSTAERTDTTGRSAGEAPGSLVSDSPVLFALVAGGLLTGGALTGVAVKRRREGPGATPDPLATWRGVGRTSANTSAAPDRSPALPTAADRWTVGTDRVTAPVHTGSVVCAVSAAGALSLIDPIDGSRETFGLGDGRPTPPVATADTAVAAVGGTLRAIDAERATQRWERELSDPVVGAPVGSAGTVYLAGQDGTIQAREIDTGTQRWQTALDATLSVGVAVDGAVVAVTDSGTVHGIDLTGEPEWQLDIGRAPSTPPAIVDDTIYVATGDGTLHAIGSQGESRWTQTLDITPVGRLACTTAAVYVSGESGTIVAVDASGAELWRTDCAEPIRSGPALVGETLYAASGHRLLGIDADTGAEQWTRSLSGPVTGTAPTSDGVYVGTESGVDALPDANRTLTDWGTATETPADSADDEGQAQPSAETTPETPAIRFAQHCGAVQSARAVDVSGPVHVYEAVDADSGESVRVLALSPAYTDDDDTAVFTDSVAQWDSISHNSHIVDVYDTGTDPRPWAVVPTADSWLPDVVSELDRAAKLQVLDDVVEGLYTAGLYNITHGNVRPGVVRVDGTDAELSASVADWGLETAVEAASVTPYTAPEQLDGRTAQTTDVYRVGLLTYWLLTERDPYSDAEDLATAIRTDALLPPSQLVALPEQIDTVLLRATATDPAERYDSLNAFRDAVRDALS